MPLSDSEIELNLRKLDKFKSKSKNLISQIRARLYTDIKNNSESPFAVLAPNTFGLASWVELKRYQNYSPVEKSLHKSHLDEVIAVFNKADLNDLLPHNGFNLMELPLSWFHEHCIPMVRREAEESNTHIQLISSFIISCQEQVFSHVRSGAAPESRLKGEKSIFLGGHIEFDEVINLSTNANYDLFEQAKLFTRELDEEVDIKNEREISFIGCIYDESREVSSQHLSLVHHVKVTSMDIAVREKGYHIQPLWLNIQELIYEAESFENWSVEMIKNINRFINYECE